MMIILHTEFFYNEIFCANSVFKNWQQFTVIVMMSFSWIVGVFFVPLFLTQRYSTISSFVISLRYLHGFPAAF